MNKRKITYNVANASVQFIHFPQNQNVDPSHNTEVRINGGLLCWIDLNDMENLVIELRKTVAKYEKSKVNIIDINKKQ